MEIPPDFELNWNNVTECDGPIFSKEKDDSFFGLRSCRNHISGSPDPWKCPNRSFKPQYWVNNYDGVISHCGGGGLEPNANSHLYEVCLLPLPNIHWDRTTFFSGHVTFFRTDFFQVTKIIPKYYKSHFSGVSKCFLVFFTVLGILK